MADFEYTGSGGIKFGGCAVASREQTFYAFFGVGDEVYVCRSARLKGVLEKVVIKKVKMVQSLATAGAPVILYQDTFNWLYNEDELCNLADAGLLAMGYYERKIAAAQKTIENACALDTCQ